MESEAGSGRRLAHQMRDELRWQTRCLLVLATIAVGLTLYMLSSVLVPFVLAVFFTVGLKPLLELIQRRLLLSRIVAVSVAFLLGVTLLIGIAAAIASSVDQLAHDKAYQQRASAATERLAELSEQLGLLPTVLDSGESRLTRFRQGLQRAATTARNWLLSGMVALSSSLGIVLIYMFFLLLGASTAQGGRSELLDMIESKLREYIVLKTLISLATGVAVWVVLAAFGVPLALLLGLLTFLLNYIPNFGPLVTCVLPLPLIWLSPDLGVFSMFAASLLACGVQLVGGNVIEPRLMGSSFDLHPIAVLLTLMLWFAIWGFVGMLLAVPMTASLKVVLERIERTKPVGRLLAGDLSQLQLQAAS